MDTEDFLQKPLQRKEFHGTETTEFLFNCYEILNILNYKSSQFIHQGQISQCILHVYTQLGNENRKEHDSLDTPIFFVTSVASDVFTNTLAPQRARLLGTQDPKAETQMLLCLATKQQQDKKLFSLPLLTCHLSPKIITELENKILQNAQKKVLKSRKLF